MLLYVVVVKSFRVIFYHIGVNDSFFFLNTLSIQETVR